MTIRKKILLGVLAGLFLTLVLWANWDFIGLTKDTFSINYGTKKAVFSFDTERDFHGDGFSIEVYQLDKKSQEYFRKPPADFFEKYPKRHYHLGDYKIYKWAKTPQSQDDIVRTSFAMRPDTTYQSWQFATDKGYGIKKYLSYADSLLKTKGNYYAMFFRDHPYGVYGIDLYIISPKEGTLTKINRQ